MGWAKYTEDNYNAICERLSLKGRDTTEVIRPANIVTQNQYKRIVEETSNFAKMFEGESCFSL